MHKFILQLSVLNGRDPSYKVYVCSCIIIWVVRILTHRKQSNMPTRSCSTPYLRQCKPVSKLAVAVCLGDYAIQRVIGFYDFFLQMLFPYIEPSMAMVLDPSS